MSSLLRHKKACKYIAANRQKKRRLASVGREEFSEEEENEQQEQQEKAQEENEEKYENEEEDQIDEENNSSFDSNQSEENNEVANSDDGEVLDDQKATGAYFPFTSKEASLLYLWAFSAPNLSKRKLQNLLTILHTPGFDVSKLPKSTYFFLKQKQEYACHENKFEKIYFVANYVIY